MDARADAARPFIEAAAPSYVSLIDRDHHLADLYNMVNVPQGVWIDEAGRIVREITQDQSLEEVWSCVISQGHELRVRMDLDGTRSRGPQEVQTLFDDCGYRDRPFSPLPSAAERENLLYQVPGTSTRLQNFLQMASVLRLTAV